MLEEEFGITVIFKKTQTLGDIKRQRRRKTTQEKHNILNPMQRVPKEICWPDNRNHENKIQRTRKLVQKEIQNKNSQFHQKE